MNAQLPVPLNREFYARSAAIVAPALLGHLLLKRIGSVWCGGTIVEVEAYLHDDPACHAVRGPTPRNQSMFGPPGHAYVYYIYGAHYCFNAVCMQEGTGEAVLIRAIEPEFGLPEMLRNRKSPPDRLTSGPGKLCSALAINREQDGVDLCNARGGLIVAAGNPLQRERLGPAVASRRIGITKAADLPLRFCLASSNHLSRSATPRS